MSDFDDAQVLDEAARILQRRSHRPNSFILAVLVRALHTVAKDIRAGKLAER